jgi:hypothetical protein
VVDLLDLPATELEVIAARQETRGWWRLEKSFYGRTPVNIEKEGEPSKWVTLQAHTTLKLFYNN